MIPKGFVPGVYQETTTGTGKGKWMIIGIIIIIIIIIYFLLKKKKNYGEALTTQAGKEVVTKETNYKLSEYQSFADQLHKAMKGWGTNEETIYRIVNSLLTRSDWLMLVNTFGVRDGKNLVAYFESELSTREMNNVKQKLNSIGVII